MIGPVAGPAPVAAPAPAVYRTATARNGHIADTDDARAWLFALEAAGDEDFDSLVEGVGALVEGSTT